MNDALDSVLGPRRDAGPDAHQRFQRAGSSVQRVDLKHEYPA
jgi:hypothetical protein